MAEGLPSGTVTFLFTDIEGSTRLWDERPDSMRPALARHDELLRAAVEGHGGYVFSAAGDGVGVGFGRSIDAVSAAVAAQRALGGRRRGQRTVLAEADVGSSRSCHAHHYVYESDNFKQWD